jgi:hypothetical protein
VQVANPGFIKTRLTDKNDFKMPFLMEPEDAAEDMIRADALDRFKISFPWAFGAPLPLQPVPARLALLPHLLTRRLPRRGFALL